MEKIRQATAVLEALGVEPWDVEAMTTAQDLIKDAKGLSYTAQDTLEAMVDSGDIEPDFASDVEAMIKALSKK